MTMPDITATASKRSVTGETQAVDLAARTIKHFISTPGLDSYHSILVSDGCDTSRFDKARSVFVNHSYIVPRDVLGLCTAFNISSAGILVETTTAERPPSLPKASEWMPDVMLWLHHTRNLRGWSVGFDPVSFRIPTRDEQDRWGKGLELIHERWKLLEYCGVGIGANEDAVTLAASAPRRDE